MVRAGEGYRTLVFSLEGCGSTIELHPPISLITCIFCHSPFVCNCQMFFLKFLSSHGVSAMMLVLIAFHHETHKWGVQDSNLRRLCHQIYSLTPLTARETPPKHVPCADLSPLKKMTCERGFQLKNSGSNPLSPPADSDL